MLTFREALAQCPLAAILRGLQPLEAVEIGQALIDAGFRILEVPMNSRSRSTALRCSARRSARTHWSAPGRSLRPTRY